MERKQAGTERKFHTIFVKRLGSSIREGGKEEARCAKEARKISRESGQRMRLWRSTKAKGVQRKGASEENLRVRGEWTKKGKNKSHRKEGWVRSDASLVRRGFVNSWGG